MIESRDFFNLRKQALIDLREVRAGKRTGLGDGERRDCEQAGGWESFIVLDFFRSEK